MAWMNTLGENVLQGYEAEFYLTITQRAASYLWDLVRECVDTDLSGGVPTDERVFDGASVNDKIVLMHEVLTALLIADAPTSKVTSTLEAAAFFPFALLIQDIECEIANENMEIFEDSDTDLKYLFRKLAWEALETLVFDDHDWALTSQYPQLLDGMEETISNDRVMLISGVWREKKEGRILLDEMK
jgi:hypothetical protein